MSEGKDQEACSLLGGAEQGGHVFVPRGLSKLDARTKGSPKEQVNQINQNLQPLQSRVHCRGLGDSRILDGFLFPLKEAGLARLPLLSKVAFPPKLGP